jgi:hypothetical protein
MIRPNCPQDQGKLVLKAGYTADVLLYYFHKENHDHEK